MIKVFATKGDFIAVSSGVLFWKKIEIGDRFLSLPEDMQKAALAHEIGHCKKWHIEQRILCLLFCFPLVLWLCRKQELEADKFAAEAGHAKALLKFFQDEFDGEGTHPSHQLRRQHLEQYV